MKPETPHGTTNEPTNGTEDESRPERNARHGRNKTTREDELGKTAHRLTNEQKRDNGENETTRPAPTARPTRRRSDKRQKRKKTTQRDHDRGNEK